MSRSSFSCSSGVTLNSARMVTCCFRLAVGLVASLITRSARNWLTLILFSTQNAWTFLRSSLVKSAYRKRRRGVSARGRKELPRLGRIVSLLDWEVMLFSPGLLTWQLRVYVSPDSTCSVGRIANVLRSLPQNFLNI